MATDNQYEDTVFVSSYPSGKTPWNLIDDKMRAILAAIKARQNDEHYWRFSNENVSDGEVPYTENAGEEGAAEGRHRPESARAWAVDVGETNDIPSLPDAKDYHEGALFVIDGDPDTNADDNAAQWKGTAWFIKNRVLLPLISRFRGKIRFAGKMIFGPEIRKWQGKLLPSGFTVNELHSDRTGDAPTTSSDNITLLPFNVFSAMQHGFPATAARDLLTLFPIRVGQFDPSTDTFVESDASTKKLSEQTPTYGVAFDIGKYDPNGTGKGTRIALTERGIEVFTSNQLATHKILINGVDVYNHTHSGEAGMGKMIPVSSIQSAGDDNNPVGILWANTYAFSPGTLGGSAPWNTFALYTTDLTAAMCQPTFADPQDPVALRMQRAIHVSVPFDLVNNDDEEPEGNRQGGTLYVKIMDGATGSPTLGTLSFGVIDKDNRIEAASGTIYVPSIAQATLLSLPTWSINEKIAISWRFVRRNGTYTTGGDDQILFGRIFLQFLAWRV